MKVLPVVFCLLLVSVPVLAKTLPEEKRASLSSQSGSPMRKLGRGVSNLSLGWLQMPNEYRECWSLAGGMMDLKIPVVDNVACFGKALVATTRRALTGAVEVVTFPTPWPWSGYSSPYDWALNEYPWQDVWAEY